MPTKTLLILVLTVAVPLSLAACGGDAKDDHTGHDHADHAGHDHADHAGHDHAGHAEPATAGEEMDHAEVDAEGARAAFDSPPPIGEKGICPVSGMAYVVDESTVFSEHEGKHYGFCCPGCKPKFDADPASFLGKPAEG